MSCPCDKSTLNGAEWSPACIGHLWVFEGLSQEELTEVVNHALRRKYQKGQSVFVQGEAANKLSLIKGGRVKLTKLTEDGMEITLDIRKAGDFFGENVFNEDFNYPVSAWCLMDTFVCSFNKERFEELVVSHPRIGLQVIKNLSNHISYLTDRMGSMSLSSLEERLYRILINVAKEHGERTPEGIVIQFPLTHEDLGFLIGAHRVSITRAMKSLRESGKIIQKGRMLALPIDAIHC